jgi:hypothetical protein
MTTRGAATRWAGWIGFAGLLMIVIGTLDAFEGLIAVIRDKYYVLTPSQIIIFDMTTWGWLTLLWGALVAFAGMSLLSRAGWARWFAIVVGCFNLVAQLAFIGDTQYPLWGLTVIGLTVLTLYALIVHWHDAEAIA